MGSGSGGVRIVNCIFIDGLSEISMDSFGCGFRRVGGIY